MARILSIDDPAALHAAAEVISGGGLIAFPTDTVYGVGGALMQPAAIASLYALKDRNSEKALPVLLASAAQLALVASAVPDSVWRLVEAFWPGALTIIVARRRDVPDLINVNSRTIGVRVPAHRGLLRLLETAHTPLASSSANLSGRDSARDASEIEAILGSGLQVILDGGVLPPGLPSTVIDMSVETPTIVRQGHISSGDIARVLGRNPLLASTTQAKAARPPYTNRESGAGRPDR